MVSHAESFNMIYCPLVLTHTHPAHAYPALPGPPCTRTLTASCDPVHASPSSLTHLWRVSAKQGGESWDGQRSSSARVGQVQHVERCRGGCRWGWGRNIQPLKSNWSCPYDLHADEFVYFPSSRPSPAAVPPTTPDTPSPSYFPTSPASSASPHPPYLVLRTLLPRLCRRHHHGSPGLQLVKAEAIISSNQNQRCSFSCCSLIILNTTLIVYSPPCYPW